MDPLTLKKVFIELCYYNAVVKVTSVSSICAAFFIVQNDVQCTLYILHIIKKLLNVDFL